MKQLRFHCLRTRLFIYKRKESVNYFSPKLPVSRPRRSATAARAKRQRLRLARRRREAEEPQTPALFFFSEPLVVFSFRPYVLCFHCIHRIHLAFVESERRASAHMRTHQEVFEVRVPRGSRREQFNMLSTGLIAFAQTRGRRRSLVPEMFNLTWHGRLG